MYNCGEIDRQKDCNENQKREFNAVILCNLRNISQCQGHVAGSADDGAH